MNEKESGYSIDADACNDSILDRGGGYSTYYANVNDLRDRVRRMLSEGTSTVTILREIKEDKKLHRLAEVPHNAGNAPEIRSQKNGNSAYNSGVYCRVLVNEDVFAQDRLLLSQ